MDIQLEPQEKYSIQTYSDTQIQIDSVCYQDSLIVCPKRVISDVAIRCISEVDESYINMLLTCEPEVIIIGHKNPQLFLSPIVISSLASKKIGIECMGIAPACRTFNVLLHEGRHVVGGFIL
jgi:uncharacterized protein